MFSDLEQARNGLLARLEIAAKLATLYGQQMR